MSDEGPAPSLRYFSRLEDMFDGGRNTIILQSTELKM
jgi:hypothetical protein